MPMHTASSLDYAARRAVIAQMAPRYQWASSAQKTLLLDTVVTVTGSARTYAIGLLKQAAASQRTIQRTIQRRRLPRYGSQI